MKKLIIASMLLTMSGAAFAQRYMTRTAKITFDATAQNSPEEIKAVNNEVAAILDRSGDFVFQVPVISFKFKNALMQEHFNENYMQSDKYPKATFKGKVSNAGDVNWSKDGTYKVSVTGDLTIHGVTKTVTVPGTVTVKGSSATATAKFSVKLADYNITIPGVVASKVAQNATIIVDAAMAQK